MLLYTITLDIRDTLTPDAFVALAIEWNQTSTQKENVIPELNWSGEHRVRFGTDQVWMDIGELEDRIAIRYRKGDPSGDIWYSDFIMNFQTRKMTVQLNRVFPNEEAAWRGRNAWSPPFFPRLLIDRNYVQDDGDLPVLHTPVILTESNLRLLTDVISRRKRYQLPVVYVSRTYRDEAPVKVDSLAYLLKGAAHVLIPETNRFDSRIRLLCNSRNEYYGAIGIYFPDSHRRFFYRAESGPDSSLLGRVFGAVVSWWKDRPADTTWDAVCEELPQEIPVDPEEPFSESDLSGEPVLETEEPAAPVAPAPSQPDSIRSLRARMREILGIFHKN